VARDQDADLSKLLAVEAVNLVDTPTYQSTSLLHQVLAADPIIARYSWPSPDLGELWTVLDPTGRLLVASGGGGFPTKHLEVADARTGTVLWSYPTKDVGTLSGDGFIGPSWFSADGKWVIAGLYWGTPMTTAGVEPPSGVALGVMIWDARTGEFQRRIDLGPCGGQVTGVSESRLLVWAPEPGPDGRTGCHWAGEEKVEVVELATGEPTVLSTRGTWVSGGTLSGDGRFAAFDLLGPGTCGEKDCFTSVVFDLANGGERVFELEGDPTCNCNYYARRLNHDGTLLLYGDRPTRVYDVAAGPAARPIAQLPGVGGAGTWAEFDPTGATAFQTSRDGTLRRWDVNTGQVLSTWPAVGGGRPSVAADDPRMVLVPDVASPTAVLLDIGLRGDLGQVQTCQGFTMGGSLDVGGGLAAFGELCPDGSAVTQVVDLEARKLLGSLPGWFAQDLAIAPDGGSFVSQEAGGPDGLSLGPLRVAALQTGSPVVELQDLCWWNESLTTPPDQQPGCTSYPQTPFPFKILSVRWSPDGTMIGAPNWRDGYLVVWDADDGHVIFKSQDYPDQASYPGVVQVCFTPDSKGLVVTFDNGLVETLSTETWKPVTTANLDQSVFGVKSLGLVGFSRDGSTILAVGGFLGSGDASLLWLDAATLDITRKVEHAHTGSPKSAALSPDGSLMATGASDGILRVWDSVTGELKQQMDFRGPEVQGVAFIDDRHLAVTPQGGGLLIMTVDPQELANTVRVSLTRTFTATECKTYGLDPCPTLEQMRTP